MNAPQIEAVLHAAVIGRIGCHTAGRTYVVPVTYAYLDGCVYGHSAAGLKVQMMRANPAVCFEVEQVDDLANWRSVIAWGTFEELRGDDAASGMKVLMDRLMPVLASATAYPGPGRGPHGAPAAPGADHAPPEAVLYRIRLAEKSGRFEKRQAAPEAQR